MDVRSAELTKYAANCMLATKISFMNEIAGLAERLGADVEAVRQGIGVGPAHRLSLHLSRRRLRRLVLPQGREGADPHRPRHRLRAEGAAGGRGPQRRAEDGDLREDPPPFRRRPQGPDLRALGASFKPNTDDMREAATRVLMEALWDAGARVQAYDPEAMEETQRIYGDRADLLLCGTKEAALRDADALVVMTEWQAFRAPDFELIAAQLEGAGGLRRPQPLRSGAHGAARASPTTRSAAAWPSRRRPPPRRRPEARALRVLVTGAAGFIGFHVARALLARGDAVVGFDVVNDYYDPGAEGGAARSSSTAPRPSRARLALRARRSRRPRRGRGRLRRRTAAVRPGDPSRRPGRGALLAWRTRSPTWRATSSASPTCSRPAGTRRRRTSPTPRPRASTAPTPRCPSPRARGSTIPCSSTPRPSGRTS